MTTITIDIETMPRGFNQEELAQIQFHQSHTTAADFLTNYDIKTGVTKDPAKIEEKCLEKGPALRDAAIAKIVESVNKTGVKPNELTIAMIGYKVGDQPAEVILNPFYKAAPGNVIENEIAGEEQMLQQFADTVPLGRISSWIGHNIKNFDGPAIWRRGIRHGIRSIVQCVPHDKWGKGMQDTMELWAGTNYRDMTGLKAIEKFLGFERESDLDGSKVAFEISEGRIDNVAGYCKEDVEMTYKVWCAITGYTPGESDKIPF
jgi:DNA polymerase elongation subunit (family B)